MSEEKTELVQEEATKLVQAIECPVCHSSNSGLESWCVECGFDLRAKPEELPELPPTAGKLVQIGGGGWEFPLKEGENTIGRLNTDIVLADDSVSRSHAKLTVEGENYFIEDLGSTNGTFYRGKQLQAGERVQIFEGDEITFGGTTLKLTGSRAPAAPPEEEIISEEVSTAAANLILQDGSGRQFGLKGGVNRIGRHPDNDIALPFDAYVSGRHGQIIFEGSQWFLEDLGSRNGTFLNGEKIPVGARCPLKDGDQIQVGTSVFVLQIPEPQI